MPTSPHRQGSSSRVVGATAVVCLLALLVLLVVAAQRQGLWWDETYTAGVVGLKGSAFWQEIVTDDQSFAPYYLLEKAAATALGTSELGLRAPSVLGHVAAVGLLWWVLRSRARLSTPASVAGCAVVALGLQTLQLSVTARGYALVMLGTVGLLAFALRVSVTRSRRAFACSVLLAVAVPWLSPLAGFGAALSSLVPVVWFMRRDRRAVVVGLAVVGVVWLVNAWLIVSNSGPSRRTLDVGWLVYSAALTLGGRWLAPVTGLLLVGAVVVLLSRCRPLAIDTDPGGNLAVMSVSMIVLPLAATIALGLLGETVWPRYAIASVVGVAGCCAWLTSRMQGRGWWVAGLVLALGLVQFATDFWRLPTGHTDDWSLATATVEQHVTPSGGLLLPDPQHRIPLGWYARDDEALGVPVWPAAAFGTTPPSTDLRQAQFGPGDTLSSPLPTTVWLLTYPGWASGAAAEGAARAALLARGYRLSGSVRLWSNPRAEGRMLERYDLQPGG